MEGNFVASVLLLFSVEKLQVVLLSMVVVLKDISVGSCSSRNHYLCPVLVAVAVVGMVVLLFVPDKTVSILSKKILAHDVVTMRTARGGENAPLIISVPSPIVKAAKYKKGEKMQIYTDGERTYLERLAEPKL
jgi:hypothetical protein